MSEICTCFIHKGYINCKGCEAQARKAAEKVCSCEVIKSINVGFEPSDECFGCDEDA